MEFKKTLLASAVAAATFSGTALAGTWFPAATDGAAGASCAAGTVPDFATELFGTGSSATVLTTDKACYKMATTPLASSIFDAKFTLTGATWGAALVSGDLDYIPNIDGNSDNGTPGVATVALTTGGTTTDTTATFRVTVTTAMEATDNLQLDFDINGANGLSDATAVVTLAAELTDSIGNADTAGTAGNVATSTAGTAGTIGANATPGDIDTATNSLKFSVVANTTLTQVLLGNIGLADGTSREDGNDNAWVTNANDALVSSVTVTATGPFTSALGTNADSNTATADGVFLDFVANNNAWQAGEEADTLTATTATWSLTGANAATIEALAANGTEIYMVTDGVTAIQAGASTVTFTVNYTNATHTDLTVGPTAMATLEKNGSTDRVEFALTPNGAYTNYIRITNPSAAAGDVTITVTDDAGTGQTINLSDISGISSNSISAGASTGLININDIAAATSTIVLTGKLRLQVDAEFGATSTTLDVGGTGVYVTALTVSTDGTTFATF